MDRARRTEGRVEAVVDNAVLEHALDVAAGFLERDALDPADDVAAGRARVAVGADPLADIARPGIVAGDRERVAAVPLVDEPLEVGAAEHDVVRGVGRQAATIIAI